MRGAIALACLIVASVATGQGITSEAKPVTVIEAGEAGEIAGAYFVLPNGSKPIAQQATEVTYDGIGDAGVTIEASDVKRLPVGVSQIGSGRYLVFTKGKRTWVQLTLIDFDAKRFEQDILVINESDDVDPEPGPGPEPDPEPTPDPDDVPDSVVNTYGLGKVAYQFAPKDDADGVAKHAAVYSQAADFLYGIPTTKAVLNNTNIYSKDPNRNVMAWIGKQYSLIQCRDQETCKQWATWRNELSNAMRANYANNQWTRQEWYQAFNEVAAALKETQK